MIERESSCQISAYQLQRSQMMRDVSNLSRLPGGKLDENLHVVAEDHRQDFIVP